MEALALGPGFLNVANFMLKFLLYKYNLETHLMIPVERFFKALGHSVVERLRQQPLDRGSLFGLKQTNTS